MMKLISTVSAPDGGPEVDLACNSDIPDAGAPEKKSACHTMGVASAPGGSDGGVDPEAPGGQLHDGHAHGGGHAGERQRLHLLKGPDGAWNSLHAQTPLQSRTSAAGDQRTMTAAMLTPLLTRVDLPQAATKMAMRVHASHG